MIKTIFFAYILFAFNVYGETAISSTRDKLERESGDCTSCQGQDQLLQQTFFLQQLESINHKIAIHEINTKNWKQLEHYFQCYGKEIFPLTERLKQTIEIVAKHFQMPSAFIGCLAFIESRFDIEAVSYNNAGKRVGAIGIAQIMDDTRLTIRNLVTHPNQSSLTECRQSFSDTQHKCPPRNDFLNYKVDCDTCNQMDGYHRCTKRECNYCKALYAREQYASSWDVLSTKMATHKVEGKALQSGPLSRTVHRHNPQESLAAMGLYLTFAMQEYDSYLIQNQSTEKLKGDLDATQNPVQQMLNLTAASYNNGLGKSLDLLHQHLKKGGTQDMAGWTNAIADNAETTNYTKRLNNCMEKNNWQAPSDQEQRDNPCQALQK